MQRQIGNQAIGSLLTQERLNVKDEASAQHQSAEDQGWNRTGMPDALRHGLEALSGLDLSIIRVHYNSSEPRRYNALAHTQGQHIYIGPGQERYLPHEGWHAIQQMQGRVQPTIQGKGFSINDEKGLENEAEFMGGLALLPKLLRSNGCGTKTAYLGGTQVTKLPRPRTSSVIQRAMKFELQTSNYIWRTMGVNNTGPEKLPRKFGPNDFIHKVTRKSDTERSAEGKESTGMELQSETDGFIEFETPKWFRK